MVTKLEIVKAVLRYLLIGFIKNLQARVIKIKRDFFNYLKLPKFSFLTSETESSNNHTAKSQTSIETVLLVNAPEQLFFPIKLSSEKLTRTRKIEKASQKYLPL